MLQATVDVKVRREPAGEGIDAHVTQRAKAPHGGPAGRDSRPLAAVAAVRDVALVRGGDRQVDLGPPRRVRTHEEQVAELRRRQSRVLVLREQREPLIDGTWRETALPFECVSLGSHWNTLMYSIHHRNASITFLTASTVQWDICYSLHRTCQTAAGGTGDPSDSTRWCSRQKLGV